ncbi:LLM class flavin-dependent oxidoreductase [Salipaludibacillus aurantiacus]|uniref:Luciferase family oxidoreductase, group 1 n=1 Tax=Salipaludibacillus aurantiacus TaxID=1601833 RepID=A0A1H9V1C7_9BACI|nr:LLM class flavin-dependent oxidoreductase [Salipaludibacillus aurantiacus]SES15472.1 luciferase family oxidoreductase, group 1 [Salipaludibacillus aurantiacus]
MKLSVLDSSPMSSGQTSQEALEESAALAREAEKLGFTRYWMTEHHDLPGLACSAPEVMLSYIGAHTKTIRLGTGAVLLPFYKPFKVAEVHNTLATLFPGRIDVGIGRTPGGSAEVTNALSDNFLEKVWQLPELIKELEGYLMSSGSWQRGEEAKISAAPLPETAPELWLLGTSKKSALLAAEKSLPYAFAHFMSDQDMEEVISQYVDNFVSGEQNRKPEVLVAVSAVCAETDKRAHEVALSSLIWSLQKEKGEGARGVPSIGEASAYPLNNSEKDKLEKMKQKMIIGSPDTAGRELQAIQSASRADEIMVMTTAFSQEDRRESYRLIAKKLFK